jgi:peptidoglycan hydrolase-like protein with peptidoglycan-binding domain
MAVRLLQYGSYGDDVRKLQTALNANGYNLDVDGGYGTKTRAAVVDYQKKNSLQVDGTVGNETWGSLASGSSVVSAPPAGTSKSVLSGVSEETANALGALEQGNAPSAEAGAARAEYESVLAGKPDAFTSDYAQQLAQLYAQIDGREAFSYDPQQDSTFRQYRDTYIRQGKQAMEDTAGKTAALTGGYASSYAQTASQQSYQAYLQQLYDRIPELEQNAQTQYNREGEELYSRYKLMQGKEEAQYDQWRDTVADWESEADRAQKNYDAARDDDVSIYKAMLTYYADKAKSEQKAATVDGVTARNNTGGAAAKTAEAFSSVAYGSLSGAMGNYLKAGNVPAAQALLQQYQSRMTAAQRQSAAALFRKYGVQA